MKFFRFFKRNISKYAFKSLGCVVFFSYLLLSLSAAELLQVFTSKEATAALDPAAKQYMISIGPVTGNVNANYVYASFFNPATSTQTLVIHRIRIGIDAVAGATYQNLTIRRITAASGAARISANEMVQKNNQSVPSVADIRYASSTVTFAGTSDSRLNTVTAPGTAGAYVGKDEVVFNQTEPITLKAGEGIALYQETAGDVDQRIRLNISWEESSSLPSAQNEFMFSFPRVENAAATDYKYATFFNPLGSGKVALIKRLSIDVDADAAAVNTNTIYIRRITAASAGTQVLAANVPKKHSDSPTSVMEFRHTGVTATLAGTIDSKYMQVTPPAVASDPHGHMELLFSTSSEYIVLGPGEGIALVSSATGDLDQIVRLSVVWSEQSSIPASQGEYLLSVGPNLGSVTVGGNHVTFFNPAASGKYVIVKRLAVRVDATTTATYIPMTVQRISAASGGTQIAAGDIPDKSTTTANSILEVRHTAVTATKVGSANARLMTLTSPGAAGFLIGHQEIKFEDGTESLVLAPGEGIAFYQEAAGDLDHKIKVLLEWKEQVSAPTAQGEYLFSTGSITGVTTNPYRYATLLNPSGSGKTILVDKINVRVDAVAAITTIIPFKTQRITAASAGTLIATADIHRKSTSSAVSIAQVRVNGVTSTLLGTSDGSFMVATSPGAAPTAAAPQLLGYEDYDISSEKIILREGEGIVVYQEGAGDADFRVKVVFDWKEQATAPTPQGEYVTSIGTVAGVATSGYVYTSFFNPATSSKQVVIKRLLLQTDAAAAAVYIPITMQRISASSGGTYIAPSDITKKDTTSATSTVDIRRSNVTVSYPRASTSRILSETSPGVSGQAIGGHELTFDSGKEVILDPGEGVAVYQETTGDTDFRVQMKIIWSESGLYSLSGSLYSDEGITQITTGGNVIKARIAGQGIYSTTTISGTGFWRIPMSGQVAATGTPVSVWVDGDSNTRAFTLTKASTTANIPNIDLYEDRVMVGHEGTSGTTTTISDLTLFDGDDDSDIQFFANSGTLAVSKGQELHIKTADTFSPGGAVRVHANASASPDGSFHMDDNAVFIPGGVLTLGGNFLADTGSTYTWGTNGILFNSTTTGRTIAGTLTGTSALASTTFNGSAGAWTFSNNASTTNLTITTGTVTAPSLLSVSGDYTNGGTFTNNSGTVFMSKTSNAQTLQGTLIGSSAFSTLNFVGTLAGGTTTGLVGHWTFDTADLTLNVTDSSGSGNTGYLQIGSGGSITSTTTVTGQRNQAISLDSTDDYVRIEDSVSMQPANVTMAAWFNCPAFAIGRAIISKPFTAGPWVNPYTSWLVRVNSNTQLEFGVNAGGTYSGVGAVVSAMSIDTWYHIAMTYTSGSQQGYFNGTNVSNTSPSGAIGYDAFPVLFGADHSASPVGDIAGCKIDDVRIYNRVLSPSEITDLYTGLPVTKTVSSNASTTNFVNDANSSVTVPAQLSIAGNYTNNGTFTHNSGTTTLSGVVQQTLTGNMIGTSAFNTLKILNNSGSDPDSSPSVIFASAASSTKLEAVTASTTIRFGAGLGYTFTNMTLNGQNTNSRVQLRSSAGGTPWKLFVTGVQSVLNTKPKDSNASGGTQIDASNASNLDGTGNTNWNFGSTVTCSTNVTSTAFSSLSLAQVQTASPNATTTFSCSSGTGCTLSATSAGNGVSPGLATSSPAYLILSSTATLSAGTEGYGIQVATTTAGTGATLFVNPVYNKTGNSVGGLTVAARTVASTTTTFSNKEVVVTHKAAIAATTPVGNYVDTITYSCVGN